MIRKNWVPSISALPPSPAIMPDMRKLKRKYFSTAKPLNLEAVMLKPTALSWKPFEVLNRK